MQHAVFPEQSAIHNLMSDRHLRFSTRGKKKSSFVINNQTQRVSFYAFLIINIITVVVVGLSSSSKFHLGLGCSLLNGHILIFIRKLGLRSGIFDGWVLISRLLLQGRCRGALVGEKIIAQPSGINNIAADCRHCQ